MTVGRIPSVEGGIQPTIFDAKADLLTATANDTPARLAVGADYGFLQADSTAGTGLAWNSGAWTSFTPTITASSGTFTTVSGQGKYQRIGKTCIYQFGVSTTTNGTAAQSVRVTLPFAAQNTGPALYAQGVVRDYFVTGLGGFAFLDPSNAYLSYAKYDGTYLGGSGYFVGGSIVYEVA